MNSDPQGPIFIAVFTGGGGVASSKSKYLWLKEPDKVEFFQNKVININNMISKMYISSGRTSNGQLVLE